MPSARHLVLAIALLFSGLLSAQADSSDVQVLAVKAWDLIDISAKVPGMGADVPGMNLLVQLKVGDSAVYAARELDETSWRKLSSSKDSIGTGTGVHWLRFGLLPDSSFKGKTLLLGLGGNEKLEVFLNGAPLFSSFEEQGQGNAIDSARIPYLVPFTFRCDGKPEVIAIRLDSVDGKTARSFGLACSIHAPDVAFRIQRNMAQYGVFIGINLVILLLALVIWSFERRERQWLFLALLSFVSALNTFNDLAGNTGLASQWSYAASISDAVQFLLVPWPLYLLIMTLGTLHGNVSGRRKRWYTISIITASTACLVFAFGIVYYKLDFSTTGRGINLTLEDPDYSLLFVVLLLGLLLGAVMLWFIIEVIRLGFKLLRTKGYARWIGAGALASSLLALLLSFIGSGHGTASGLHTFLETVREYCSQVAVPLSVAIYLAIRTAHHGRLVARQRDDLDLEVKERTAELSAEKERSDELLLNILPAEVAEELKATGSAKARHFDQASVLFTDFKGFTGMATYLGADVLLQELNACFEAFDAIITRHGIEKIKTIGDAYMCAGGLPDPSTSSPVAVVRAALEMQAFMAERKKRHDAIGQPVFEMRVGIHTGPVVAGIVGVKKFQYDIWGDTVNTASRMESNGEVGRVNISESTYEIVKDEPGLAFTPRGEIQVKGKGKLEMYFVSAL